MIPVSMVTSRNYQTGIFFITQHGLELNSGETKLDRRSLYLVYMQKRNPHIKRINKNVKEEHFSDKR